MKFFTPFAKSENAFSISTETSKRLFEKSKVYLFTGQFWNRQCHMQKCKLNPSSEISTSKNNNIRCQQQQGQTRKNIECICQSWN